MEAQGSWVFYLPTKKLLFLTFWLLNLVAPIYCDEQLLIINKPNYLTFHENSSLRVSEIPEVLSSILGFTTLNDDKWPGVGSGNPLKRPEAIVIVEIEGLKEAQLKTPGIKFPLRTDVEPGWSYQIFSDRTYIRFADKNPVLMNINNDDSLYTLKAEYMAILDSLAVRPDELKAKVLGNDSATGGRDGLKALNVSLVPDMKFLMDAQILYEFARIVKLKSVLLQNGVPDLFWFHLTGIQELVFVYGYESDRVREAIAVLDHALDQLKDAFVQVYKSNAVIAILAVDYQTGNSIRAGRNLLEVTTESPASENIFNIATPYDETYSAIFNITLFIMLVFWLAIFAIALGIWHMDPGRDSVIYRMTTQRMKKDQ